MSRTYNDNMCWGQKSHWRRSAWNNIARRIPNKKQAVCLYMPAKKDHDRRIACSKGFLSSRLVAVDRDKAVVDSIKRQGKPVIHGDIFDAARAWLDATVVFADLQGGMTLGVASFMAEFCWGALAPTGGGVLAINMRRGQDTGNKLLCELVDNFPGLGECLAKSGQKDAMTNRAIIMFSAWMMCLADFSRRSTACDREAQSVYNDLQEMCDPSFLSYKSQGGAYYDTFIVSSLAGPIAKSADYQGLVSSKRKSLKASVPNGLLSSVAAQKAVLTMRMSGKRRHAPAY
jgi:hypothetical protein